MPDSTSVLRATLNVPYECAFRKAGTVNGLPTYQIPPLTTLHGMTFAALGRPSLLTISLHDHIGVMDSDDLEQEQEKRDELIENTQWGLRVIDSGVRDTNLSSRYKMDDGKSEYTFKGYVAKEEALLDPTYRLYIGGDEDALENLQGAFNDPVFPLSLGRSDDIVVFEDMDIVDAEYRNEGADLDCVTPNTKGDTLEMLPVKEERKEGRSNLPSEVKAVSVDGGEVDGYYECDDGERLVFID